MVEQRRDHDVEDSAATPGDDPRSGGDREPAQPPRDDPDAPGLSVEDTESDEAVEPNEPG